MTEPVEIYRLRLARGNYSSGGGAWTLYESRKQFEEALFVALIEEAANSKNDKPEDDDRSCGSSTSCVMAKTLA